MKDKAKSSVGGLVKYLEDKKSNERVADVRINNCTSYDTEGAVSEIVNVQNTNHLSKTDKTFHMVLSCATQDNVSNEQLQEMAQEMITALGYKEHQNIVIIHDDTDNKHAHIVINKVHPKTFKTLTVRQDYKIMSDVCSRLEDEYGLFKVNHQSRKSESERLADDQERHTGIETLLNWIKRNCLDELKQATSWDDFNKTLAENGLQIRVKANGFVIESDSKHQVKASSIARELSYKKLTERLGEFEPFTRKVKVKKFYTVKPITHGYNTDALYARYLAEQDFSKKNKDRLFKIAKDKRIDLSAEIKGAYKNKRQLIKLMGISKDSKKLLYAMLHKEMLSKLKTVSKDYKKGREIIWNKCGSKSWADWLRDKATQGDEEALKALRARSDKPNLSGNKLIESGADIALPVDSITKNGTVIYSGKNVVVRDDGRKIKTTKQEKLSGDTRRSAASIKRNWRVGSSKDIRQNRAEPPPEIINRLRNMQEQPLVGNTRGSEVLLQSNVSDNVVNRQPRSDSKLRRNGDLNNGKGKKR